MSERDTQQAALEAARADDSKVVAWISIDIEAMLALSRDEQNKMFRQAGAMVRRSLLREFVKHRKARRARLVDRTD